MLLPLSLLAQRDTENFGKFTSDDGTIIKGDVMTKGYERQLQINNLIANSANNNTKISFTIPNGNASGIFRSVLNTKQKLRSGEIVVTTTNAEKRLIAYKINMQDIVVNECVDSNGQTSLQLTATKIGWTYYTLDKMGRTTISGKNGWDASAKRAWTEF